MGSLVGVFKRLEALAQGRRAGKSARVTATEAHGDVPVVLAELGDFRDGVGRARVDRHDHREVENDKLGLPLLPRQLPLQLVGDLRAVPEEDVALELHDEDAPRGLPQHFGLSRASPLAGLQRRGRHDAPDDLGMLRLLQREGKRAAEHAEAEARRHPPHGHHQRDEQDGAVLEAIELPEAVHQRLRREIQADVDEQASRHAPGHERHHVRADEEEEHQQRGQGESLEPAAAAASREEQAVRVAEIVLQAACEARQEIADAMRDELLVHVDLRADGDAQRRDVDGRVHQAEDGQRGDGGPAGAHDAPVHEAEVHDLPHEEDVRVLRLLEEEARVARSVDRHARQQQPDVEQRRDGDEVERRQQLPIRDPEQDPQEDLQDHRNDPQGAHRAFQVRLQGLQVPLPVEVGGHLEARGGDEEADAADAAHDHVLGEEVRGIAQLEEA
eukprot:scaffold11_cov257-Pinguiococcus_pyrenoidosus.AAC.1